MLTYRLFLSKNHQNSFSYPYVVNFKNMAGPRKEFDQAVAGARSALQVSFEEPQFDLDRWVRDVESEFGQAATEQALDELTTPTYPDGMTTLERAVRHTRGQ